MNIKDLFDHCGLGHVMSGPVAVKGGLMHSLYFVETKGHRYAVKYLNALVMQREGVLGHIRTSERIGIELIAYVSGVPAKVFDGSPIIEFQGKYYIIFDWIEGHSIFPPNITRDHCEKIGGILGKIHRLNISYRGIKKEDKSSPMFQWERYLALGIESGASWVDEVRVMMTSIKGWNRALIQAGKVLNENQVISHRDLDPKNVMWQDGMPFLIDWEAAGYVNPYQELLEMLNCWSDDGKGALIKENFDALFNAYKKEVKFEGIDWEAIIVSGYSGLLGWLDYSFKRSLGIESSSDEETALGTEHVVATMKELSQYEQKTAVLLSWLE